MGRGILWRPPAYSLFILYSFLISKCHCKIPKVSISLGTLKQVDIKIANFDIGPSILLWIAQKYQR